MSYTSDNFAVNASVVNMFYYMYITMYIALYNIIYYKCYLQSYNLKPYLLCT